ncbi:MAG: hypothetical protein CBC22_07025 [Alphaproteobacteria bacterium TMED62]|nr:MAG: hypothetical protein CBC22_07025 [Alphaproteobacteria bacterium TMED62]|tara:strand:- start:2118 stop:2540 length:423 start_codon:yes stop_codon:yes gene_type:complete
MYTNKSKNLQKYKLTEESSFIVKDKSAVISAILIELKRSMNIVVEKIESTKEWKPSDEDIKLKNTHFTKALTAIYSLQVSLNFDEGGNIALKLFQLYEYCRQQLIKGYSKKVVSGIKKAVEAIVSISEAWQIGVKNAKTA